MKLKTKLIIGLFLMGSLTFAQDDQIEKEKAKLGIEFDAAWVSKYIWRGFDLYDDRAAFQPSIDFDLFGTGFSVNVWGSTACSHDYGDSDVKCSPKTVPLLNREYRIQLNNFLLKGYSHEKKKVQCGTDSKKTQRSRCSLNFRQHSRTGMQAA